MACGTPVIVSCITALPEVVGDAGLLVDPFDWAFIIAGAFVIPRLRARVGSARLVTGAMFVTAAATALVATASNVVLVGVALILAAASRFLVRRTERLVGGGETPIEAAERPALQVSG